MNENQLEEKSLEEYKEQKGIFQWIKSTFAKLKERFRPTKNVGETQNTRQEEGELSEEQLDSVKAGYPDHSVLDFDELEAEIDGLKPKSWDLTTEEQEKVEEGYEEIRAAYDQPKQDEQELTEEELDDVKAGQPIIDDEYGRE